MMTGNVVMNGDIMGGTLTDQMMDLGDATTELTTATRTRALRMRELARRDTLMGRSAMGYIKARGTMRRMGRSVSRYRNFLGRSTYDYNLGRYRVNGKFASSANVGNWATKSILKTKGALAHAGKWVANSKVGHFASNLGNDIKLLRGGSNAVVQTTKAVAKSGKALSTVSKLGKGFGTIGKSLGAVGKVGGRFIPGVGIALSVGSAAMDISSASSQYKQKEREIEASNMSDMEKARAKDYAIREKNKKVGGAVGIAGGAAAGAAIGSVIPVVGTAIGGLIGGAVGAFGGNVLGKGIGGLFGGSNEKKLKEKKEREEQDKLDNVKKFRGSSSDRGVDDISRTVDNIYSYLISGKLNASHGVSGKVLRVPELKNNGLSLASLTPIGIGINLLSKGVKNLVSHSTSSVNRLLNNKHFKNVTNIVGAVSTISNRYDDSAINQTNRNESSYANQINRDDNVITNQAYRYGDSYANQTNRNNSSITNQAYRYGDSYANQTNRNDSSIANQTYRNENGYVNQVNKSENNYNSQSNRNESTVISRDVNTADSNLNVIKQADSNVNTVNNSSFSRNDFDMSAFVKIMEMFGFVTKNIKALLGSDGSTVSVLSNSKEIIKSIATVNKEFDSATTTTNNNNNRVLNSDISKSISISEKTLKVPSLKVNRLKNVSLKQSGAKFGVSSKDEKVINNVTDSNVEKLVSSITDHNSEKVVNNVIDRNFKTSNTVNNESKSESAESVSVVGNTVKVSSTSEKEVVNNLRENPIQLGLKGIFNKIKGLFAHQTPSTSIFNTVNNKQAVKNVSDKSKALPLVSTENANIKTFISNEKNNETFKTFLGNKENVVNSLNRKTSEFVLDKVKQLSYVKNDHIVSSNAIGSFKNELNGEPIKPINNISGVLAIAPNESAKVEPSKPIGEKTYISPAIEGIGVKVASTSVPTVKDINLNVSGTIRLDGGNGNSASFNIDDLIKDPTFVRKIKDMIVKSMSETENGGKQNLESDRSNRRR